jgi:peptidoglycan hydrolase-like protein with peptidoglycan-binding domain
MKSVKAALIAMLLVLTLILGGCYSDPNAVTTTGSGGDNLNFPVYQVPTNPPTAAPSATDDPTDTPNYQVPSQVTSQVVNLATPAVNDWTTVAPLPTADPAAQATATVKPAVTATATPQGSLKLGSQGDEVRNVQRKLRELGFYKGTVDGDFGEGTEKAVKAFQKQYGLTADGKVGAKTMAALNDSSAVTYHVVPTYTKLYRGCYGKDVTKLQQTLATKGFYTGAITGYYSYATYAAVQDFQMTNNLKVDGIAGQETLSLLYK